MRYDVEIFKRQYPILNDFVYHYVSYRGLYSIIDSLPGEIEFWNRSTDAHIKIAISSWCMIFGSEGSNPTHWKKIILEDKPNIRKEFRNIILKECNLKDSEWDNYWKEIVNFRNQFVVHRDLNFNESTPYFDNLFKIAVAYDLWIREKIEPDYLNFRTLYEMSNKYENEIGQTLSLVLKS